MTQSASSAAYAKLVEQSRIRREIEGVSKPNENKEIYQFRLRGEGDIYRNTFLTFQLDLTVEYPFKPPILRFTHPMYHPNVDQIANEMCSSLLSSENWKPATTIEDILLNVLELLNDPDLSRPVNFEAAHDFIENHEKYVKKCSELARRQTNFKQHQASFPPPTYEDRQLIRTLLWQMEDWDVRTAETLTSPPTSTAMHYSSPNTATNSSFMKNQGDSMEQPFYLVTEDGVKKEVDRCELAYYSKFFRSLFTSDYSDSRSSVFRLSIVHSSDIEALLGVHKDFERGLSPQFSISEALNLLTPAAYLQFDTVVEYLSNVIAAKVTPQNIITLLRYSLMRSALLARKIWSVIVREFQVLYATKEFLKLQESELIALLSDKNLVIDSKDEVNVVEEWRAAHPESTRLTSFSKARFTKRHLPDGAYNPVIRNRVPAEAIVAHGGWGNNGATAIIEIYNSRAQRWYPCRLGLESEPPRAYHGVELINDSLVVCGGFDGVTQFQTTRIFDLPTRKWRDGRNMNEKRCYLTTTQIVDSYGHSHIAACGGFNGTNRLLSVEFYNPIVDKWAKGASLSKVRSDGATFTLNGKVYCVGGFDGSSMHWDAEYFDAEANSWVQMSRHMRIRRTGCAGTALTDNVAIVGGGFDGRKRLNSAEMMDRREGIWHPLPEMLTGRSNFGMSVLGNYVHVAGGFDGERTTHENERFDFRNRRWQALPDLSETKSALRLIKIASQPTLEALLHVPDEKIVVEW
ncbi:unnamed protein product [Caenorhabditis auriculariae]|uniref:BTB domain-containing protein n=1 Tax=Caenorhabditis auriculariae TaxID=2777116 RepID=A0A8S1H8Y8_9PELO|nr:unnamed protein product [Caenorhabditis auriculariae]